MEWTLFMAKKTSHTRKEGREEEGLPKKKAAQYVSFATIGAVDS